MKIAKISAAAAVALALAACGETNTAPSNTATPAAEAPAAGQGEVYSASGEVTEVSDGTVTISHGPVEGIGWPAMTMGFKAPAPEMVQGINVGDPVSFQFRQAGGDYVLTSITKAQQ